MNQRELKKHFHVKMIQLPETGSEIIQLRLTAAAQLAGSGRRLLDIGCGPGQLAALLKDSFAEYYGADCDATALGTASSRGIKVFRFDIDAAKFPYDDDFFDVVVAADIIEHVKDAVGFARECRRVLKPGGRLVLTTPNIRYIYHLLKLVVKGRFPGTANDLRGYDDLGHVHYFTFRDIREVLQTAGFLKIEEKDLGEWAPVTFSGRVKRRFKSLFGARFKREFFSSSAVIRACK